MHALKYDTMNRFKCEEFALLLISKLNFKSVLAFILMVRTVELLIDKW